MLAELGFLVMGCELLFGGNDDRNDKKSRRHSDDGYHDRRKQESFNSRMYDELYG